MYIRLKDYATQPQTIKGTTRTLECAEANSLTVQWYKDDQLLTEGGKYTIDSTSLTIANLDTVDTANYKCTTVSNGAQSKIVEIEVLCEYLYYLLVR